MNPTYDIAINLISDLLSWIIVLGLVGLFALSRTSRFRRQLFNFFGLTRSTPKIHVYMSRVNVKPGGATMIEGEDWPTFAGPVVSAREFIVLPHLERLFRTALLDKIPDAIRDLLTSRQPSLARIDIFFHPSPSSMSEVSDGAVVFVGGSLVNIGTRYYQRTLSLVEIDYEGHEVVVTRGSLKGVRIKPTSETITIEGGKRPAHDLGIIERIQDNENKRIAIIAAGTGSNGAMAAVLYLADHWQELHSQFYVNNRSNFAIIIECPNRRIEEKGYLHPVKRSEVTV